jgi:hypothetical protein
MDFTPRPEPRDRGYTEICKRSILPSHTAELMEAYNKGFYYLAQAIWAINENEPALTNDTIFCDRGEILPRIINVLAGASHETIAMLIGRQGHTIFQRPTPKELRLPFQHWIKVPALTPHDEERPVIYGLILSSEKGSLPSVRNVLKCVHLMNDYVATFANDSVHWTEMDELALEIDEMSSGKEVERNWRPSEAQRKHWTQNARGPILHPRRYARNKSNREAISDFTQRLIRVLRALGQDRLDESLPWTLVDIGWSYKPIKRRQSHYDHEGKDHVVKKYAPNLVMTLRC